VPFINTAGCEFEKLTNEEVVVSLENKRKARNHIGQIHAAAMALIAETASGFVLAMNMPDDKLNLIKSMKVNYLKRTKGKMTARATITTEQVALMHSQPKGDILIEVHVTDESGKNPSPAKWFGHGYPKNSPTFQRWDKSSPTIYRWVNEHPNVSPAHRFNDGTNTMGNLKSIFCLQSSVLAIITHCSKKRKNKQNQRNQPPKMIDLIKAKE
jgi:uncharacterized protein (TIGR00369 family)